MTSTKTTSSVFRPVLCFMLGLILCSFGIFHSVNGYPGPDNFARFADTLPALTAVASFALGVAASLAGLLLLVPALLRLRSRRQPLRPAFAGSRSPYADRGMPAPRPAPSNRDDDFDPDPDPDNYDEDYRNGYGHGSHGNGDYDDRRRAGIYR